MSTQNDLKSIVLWPNYGKKQSKKPKRYIEDAEIQAVIQWADLQPEIKGMLLHIENERNCSYYLGKIRKKMGVRKGVSDVFLPYPVGIYHGLWVELKGPKGMKGYKPASISIEQKIWINRMIDHDYYACVAYGADETILIMKNYINGCIKCPVTYDYENCRR